MLNISGVPRRPVARVIMDGVGVNAGYSVIVTADHGNCEVMVDPVTGEPHTQHTTYPVPCLVIDENTWQLSCSGTLANVAPTVLQLMGVAAPPGMTSPSLLLKPLADARRQFDRKPGLKGVA